MWTPFDSIGDFFSGVGDWLGNGIGGFFDMFESGAARRQEQQSQNALMWQVNQDLWNRQFSEDQAALQKQAFDKQFQLATSPISTVLADAQKNGINPMAAMGQSAGSVSAGSVSAPGSSVNNPGANLSGGSNLNGLLGILGGLVGEGIRSDTQQGISKRQQQTAEYVADKNAETQVKIAEMEDSFKRDELKKNEQLRTSELEETRSFHAAQAKKMQDDVEIALRDAKVKEGQLELAKQERFDELSERVARNAQRYANMDDMYRQYQLKEKQLQEAIRSNNMKLAGTILSSLCIIAASIIGGPVGGVAAAGISAWLAGGKTPAGFRVD